MVNYNKLVAKPYLAPLKILEKNTVRMVSLLLSIDGTALLFE